MERNEYLFIGAALTMAVVFVALTLSGVVEDGGEAGFLPSGGGAGQVREIDALEIKRLIEQGALSGREALYYREHAPGAPAAGP